MAAIKFTDLAACESQVADVRSDSTDTNWALFTYAAGTNDVLEHVASGTGGIEEIHAHLKEDMIAYALLRIVDLVDGHKTIKFVKVVYDGPQVRIMLRARMGTQKVKVNEFLGQFHCDIEGTNFEELSEEALQEKVQRATGGGTRVFDDDRQRGSATAVTPKEGSASSSSSSAPRRAYVGSFGDEQRRKAQQNASNVRRSKFAGATPSRGYVGSYGDEQRRQAQAAMSNVGRDKFSGSASSYSGGGLSFVDQANLNSQKLASSANRAGTDCIVKSEVKMSSGYVGSYGEEQRKAAQAHASNPHKTLLSTEKPVSSGLSFVDQANLNSQKLASSANRAGTDCIVKSEVRMTSGYVGTYGEDQRKAAQAQASNPHKTLLSTEKPVSSGLSFVDQANLRSQKLASEANKSQTDHIVKSSEKATAAYVGTYGDSQRKAAQANASSLHKTMLATDAPVNSTYVGAYGDSQRKAAQANASSLHKTMLSTDAPAASAHLGVADAQAVKTQRQTEEMKKSGADQIVRSVEKSVGSSELGMADAHAVKAQKQTSEMKKSGADQIVRNVEKSVGSAELGMADAHAVKAQKQTSEMLSSGQDLILKYAGDKTAVPSKAEDSEGEQDEEEAAGV